MLNFNYPSKKALKEAVGQRLRFTKTSIFGNEFKPDGKLLGTNHPKRSWYAEVTMEGGLIKKVT